MRHSIKRISKSALSVILALMMVVSTMVVGMVTTSAASRSVILYFAYSGSYEVWPENWGGTSNGSWYKADAVSGETFDGKQVYSCALYDDSTGANLHFKNGDTTISNISNIINGDGISNYTSKIYVVTSDASGSASGSWQDYTSSGGDDPIAVTNADLLSVLKGENVMFYGGELTEWNQSTFLVMNTNNTSDIAASGTMTGNYNLSSQGSTEFAAFCLPSKDYYMGHWNSGLHTTVEEGAAYIVRGSTSGTGFTQKSQSDSNYLYSYNNGATLTATTTCTLNDDGTLTVNTSSDKGKSTIGLPNSFKYYITSDNSTFTEYALTDGKLDTSSLDGGTYTLKTVLTDGNIYVVGDTDTFTVSSKTNLPKPELTDIPQYVDLTSDSKTVTLSVSNASSYPAGANVTYSFYREGDDTALYTGEDSSYNVDLTTAGTYNYYVTINSYDTDNYTCADVTSENKSVIAVKPVTVSVSAGANGKAYVSSYTTYDNQTKSNTDTTLTSVKVAPNSSVTFTAVPDEGYAVGAWNGSESSGSATHTVSSVTAATNVTVSFSDKPKFSYALVGASTIKDSNGQAAAWNGGTSDNPNQADFDSSSSLKFTNNKLVVNADANAQFRFIGTDGTNYYHYGSANNSNETIVYGTTYNTNPGDKLVYKFNEAGTFEIEITSGTESPMSFKVTKLSTYYISGRFKVRASEDATTFTYTSTNSSTNNWSDTSKEIPFTYVGDGLYKLDTYCTIKELSKQISSSDPYFLIYDGTTKYVSNVSKMHDMEDHDESSKVKLKTFSSDTTDDYLKFSDTSSTDTSLITLYLDTSGSSKQIYYVAESGKTALDAPSIATDIETLTTSNPTATITVTPATYPDGVDVEYYLYNGGTYVANTTGTTFTVSSAGTYTVKAYPPADNPDYKESVASNAVVIADGRTPVAVKAMNGIMNGEVYTGTTTAEAANTSSSVVWNESSDLSGGKEYTVTKGSTVTVTTTMAADTTTAEKFVYAYVVNNKDTYLATEGIAVTGEDGKKYATYSANFTIAEDATATTFTVVPIYYYKACAKDGEYIKFYVNPKESSWTYVYNYAYYYGTQDGESIKESDGAWPGQPMLYDETKQLFYSLVPKSINNQPVSGLTVNNNGEEQTYDFDDFKYIYESGYDIVRLDLKYKTGNGLNKTKISASHSTTDGFTASSHPTNISAFDTRWEAFNDINGKPMSILGKETTDTTNKVYIVSTALYNISNRGQYMTAWYVYKADSNGNLTFVTAACPSDFVPRPYSGAQTEKSVNTTAYNAILDAGLGNAPVQIVFEDVQSKDTKNRFDGRWYYAQSDSEVSAYAYYRTTDNGTTYSALKQDAAYASVNGAVSVTNPKLGLDISVVSSPLAGYIFDHWSVADKDGNIIINKLDNVGSSFTTTLDQEMHYVANFRKATEGQLVINHSKYTGSDAKKGLGYYRLEVQVMDKDGNWSTVYAGSGTGDNGQSITADLNETDQTIRIKLITETAGENTFLYWYTTSSDGIEIIEDPDGDMTCNGTATSEPTGKNGILTYTFDTEVWKLFRDGHQKVTQLNFYSDIAPMNKNYKLTYLYDDRFGNQKSYVVTGTHDDSYYVKNNNSWSPSDELITKNAPPIDDLYKNCKWIIVKSNKVGTEATLVADQYQKNYKVDIYDASGAYEPFTLPINSYVKNDKDEFFVAAKQDAEGKNFSYWAVYKRNSDGTDGAEVARHFYREFTLVVLDDYNIKPIYGNEVKDQLYISAPQYTREKYSNEDGTIVKDSLYVDFMVAYMSAAGELIRSDVSGEKYKTGLIIEIGQNRVLGTNEDTSVNTDYSGLEFESNEAMIKTAAGTENGKVTNYCYNDDDNDKRKLYNFRATNTNYNNMNRLDYAVPFNNTDKNLKYVMKAYYYVIVNGEVLLSNPVYFNLYEIGTSDPDTVK